MQLYFRINKASLFDGTFEQSLYVPIRIRSFLMAPKKVEPEFGVIASAWVTTIVEGGLELKRYDVLAQCVLLNYRGCKKHWYPEGVATCLCKLELERVLSK